MFGVLTMCLFAGVTILLSLTVFLNLVAETLPQVSDAIPLLGTLPKPYPDRSFSSHFIPSFVFLHNSPLIRYLATGMWKEIIAVNRHFFKYKKWSLTTVIAKFYACRLPVARYVIRRSFSPYLISFSSFSLFYILSFCVYKRTG